LAIIRHTTNVYNNNQQITSEYQTATKYLPNDNGILRYYQRLGLHHSLFINAFSMKTVLWTVKAI